MNLSFLTLGESALFFVIYTSGIVSSVRAFIALGENYEAFLL
jgi:hypothetical protein